MHFEFESFTPAAVRSFVLAGASLPGARPAAAPPRRRPHRTGQRDLPHLPRRQERQTRSATPRRQGAALHAIPPDKFGKSVHARMQCVACHTDIKDNADKGNAHAKDTAQPLKKVDCAGCHQELWEQTQKRGRTASGRGWASSPRTSRPTRSRSTRGPTRTTRPSRMPRATTATTRTASMCRPRTRPQHTQWRLGISGLRRNLPHRPARGLLGFGARQGNQRRTCWPRRRSAPTATPPTRSAAPPATRSSCA